MNRFIDLTVNIPFGVIIWNYSDIVADHREDVKLHYMVVMHSKRQTPAGNEQNVKPVQLQFAQVLNFNIALISSVDQINHMHF